MTTIYDYRAALLTVAHSPQELRPEDARRAIDAGRQRFNAFEFRGYVQWLLNYATPETRDAIRAAYSGRLF